MREIKFRAWHTKNKVMYEHKNIPVLLKNVADDNVWEYMQWTGILSTDIKLPIYEGDIIECDAFWMGILEYSKGVGEVIFTNAGYFLKTPECLTSDWHNSPLRKIIGNIYENPELIQTLTDENEIAKEG
jgi:hypothetical protein